MVNIILFVQVDFQYILDAMDLSENGTKSYGKYIIIEAEKEGDVRKLVQDDIVAAYCNNKYYVKPGIKTLSIGQSWITVDDFSKYCKKIINSEE